MGRTTGLVTVFFLPVVALAVFSAPAAKAVLIDARVTSVLTGVGPPPTAVTLLDGNAYGGVYVGNTVVVGVDITTPATESIQAIYSTLDFDPSQLSFLGGSFSSSVVVGTCTGFLCVPPALNQFGTPELKSTDPTGGEILSTQAISPTPLISTGHTTTDTVILGFEVLNVDDPIRIGIDIGFGHGIWVEGIVVEDANQASHNDLVQFDPAIIYGPEPGVIPLLMSGLLGLSLLWRLRQRHTLAERSSRIRSAGLIAAVVLLALPAAAQDADSDGVLDSQDNCTLVANAGQEDEDLDGFGTVCDGDFNQDGYVFGLDIIDWFDMCFGFSLPICDVAGDGNGGGASALIHLESVLWNLPVGPSGWSCATIPPVDVSMGDPPCLGP